MNNDAGIWFSQVSDQQEAFMKSLHIQKVMGIRRRIFIKFSVDTFDTFIFMLMPLHLSNEHIWD